MKTIEQIAAEILVECEYADRVSGGHNHPIYGPKYFVEHGHTALRPMPIEVDPFADTLEGYRQADAIEDWLHNEHYSLIQQAKVAEMLQKDNPNNDFMGQYSGRQKRLNRIKLCLEQLRNEE